MATEKKNARWLHPVRVLLMAVILGVMAIVVWILPLRPTVSEVEKRELAKFPALTAEALLSGSFFDDINTWFADTFPGREALVSFGSDIKGLFGLRGQGIVQSDQYGDADSIGTLPPSTTTTTGSNTTGVDGSTTITTTTTYGGPKWEPDEDLKGQHEALDNIMIDGGTAYEYYHFNQSLADGYVQTIARAGSLLKDIQVYNLIVPTSVDIMLPADQQPAGVSSQKDALEYFSAWITHYNSSVKVINPREALLAHNKEYIYFHSDHHWTALGAYYAYLEFAKTAGLEPVMLDEAFETVEFDGFRGTFYASAQAAGYRLSDDTVYAYKPKDDVSMEFVQNDGQTLAWPVIMDVSDWAASSKYNCFIGGDQPLATIVNESIEEESSIIVVKDSYGNAFTPFLTAHYRTVYVVDPRHFNDVFDQTLPEFAQEKGVDAVLFLNNIGATRNPIVVPALADLVG